MVPHWDLQNVESEVSSSVKDPFLALFNVLLYLNVKVLKNLQVRKLLLVQFSRWCVSSGLVSGVCAGILWMTNGIIC